MKKQLIAVTALVFLTLASSAYAQKAQVGVLFGGTLSDGVTGSGVVAANGNVYDAVDLKDGFSWGFDFGYNASDKIEIGFLYGQQFSTLRVEGTATTNIGDLKINTYHPYIGFNFKAPDAKVRPYFLVGFGATNYGGVDFTRADGTTGTTGSQTQFSTTWGLGAKVYGSKNVGARFGVEWTPTYIKTDSAGWWCDPYWGCYVVGNAQYSNQFQFNGGLTFRF
jgi:OprF-like membrane protein